MKTIFSLSSISKKQSTRYLKAEQSAHIESSASLLRHPTILEWYCYSRKALERIITYFVFFVIVIVFKTLEILSSYFGRQFLLLQAVNDFSIIFIAYYRDLQFLLFRDLRLIMILSH